MKKFKSPNDWPDVLDRFVLVARSHFTTLATEMFSLFEGIDDVFYMKIKTLQNVPNPNIIPELLRTKLEPEIEDDEREKVRLFHNEFEYEGIDNIIGYYKSILIEVDESFREMRKEYFPQEENKSESLKHKIVTPKHGDILLNYYNTLNEGKNLQPQQQQVSHPPNYPPINRVPYQNPPRYNPPMPNPRYGYGYGRPPVMPPGMRNFPMMVPPHPMIPNMPNPNPNQQYR